MQSLSIEDILPHRGRFKLVDRILSVDESGARTESRVRPDWPLVRADGVDPLICVELVAQTGGVHIYWLESKKGTIQSRQSGWLVGVKSATFQTASIPLDAVVTVTARRHGAQGEYYEVAGTVTVGTLPVGDVVLQVVQSDQMTVTP